MSTVFRLYFVLQLKRNLKHFYNLLEMSNSSVLIHTTINPIHNRDYFSSKDRVKRYEKKCFGSKNGDLSDRHGELNERHGVLKFKIIRAESPWDKTPQFSILLTSGVLSHIDCIKVFSNEDHLDLEWKMDLRCGLLSGGFE